MPSRQTTIIDPDVEANKLFAALSYLWVLCLVPLFWKRSSPFAQFHAKQGLVLFIIEVIVGVIMFIPFFGQILLMLCVIAAVIGFIKAWNGEWWQAPVLHEWSKKF